MRWQTARQPIRIGFMLDFCTSMFFVKCYDRYSKYILMGDQYVLILKYKLI